MEFKRGDIVQISGTYYYVCNVIKYATITELDFGFNLTYSVDLFTLATSILRE